MSTSAGTTSSASLYTTPAFWERLWRTAGLQSVLCFIVAYIVYGQQPPIGASPEALATFYGADRMRILIAAVFYGLAVLNLMWFAAALRTTLADAGQDGWGAAAVVLGLLGGTTWLTGGFWAPDGVYSRFVWPAIGVLWGMVVSGVLLTRSPATRSGW